MTDGFTQVPLGRAGTGEAVILPQNQQFTNFTRDILRLRQQEQQEAKAQEQDLAEMLGEDLTAKWTEDTIKYFQPKIDEFRKEAVEVFKQNQGRLSPIQMYELKSKFGKLKQEVALNNELYAQEQKRLDELRKDKLSNAPNLDLKESEQLRMIYNNPWKDPEYAAEIKNVYGGNVNAWRAANQGLFENVRSFSPEQYINKNFQDKLSEDYISDEQGRPVAQKTPEGRMFYTKKKFIPQEKIEARVNTAFSGTDYEDTRFKQHYLKEAQQMPINYRTKGVPSLDEEGWKDPELFKFMADEIAKTPELASLNAQQQQQWVARKKATYDVKSKFPESRAVEWYDPKRVKKSGSDGSGNDEDKTVTIPSDYYNRVTESISQGKTPLQVAQDIGGKLVDKGQIQIPIEPTIAMNAIEVGADKILTKQDGKYRPLNGKGMVAGTPKTAVIMFKKNGVTVPMNTEGAKPFMQVIMQPIIEQKQTGPSGPSFTERQPSITGEVNRAILDNNSKIFKSGEDVFKVEYDLSDPVQNALVSKLYYGGTTISSGQYKREKQNISKPATKKTTPTFNMK